MKKIGMGKKAHWIAPVYLVAALTGCGPRPSGPGGVTVSSAKIAAPTEVSFPTADGWTVVGDLYKPPIPSKGTVILLHQRGGSAQDWKSLSSAMQEKGITVIALDQRGAGRSTKGPGPTGEDAPWATSGDIAAAIASVKDKNPIGLVGASYGANNALIYAAAHSQQIRGIVLFSPGTDYHGLLALPAAKVYHGAVAIYHDKGDSIAGEGPQQINAALPSADHALYLADGSAHGTDLLNPDIIKEVVGYFHRLF